MGGELQQLYTQVARSMSHCHGLSMVQEFCGLEAVSDDEALIVFFIRHLVASELHPNWVTPFVVVYIQYLEFCHLL